VMTLTDLGLQTEVQDAVGAYGDQLVMARVRNVVALLPGTDSTGRLFLVGHYDSVPVGPGANDDGTGTSAILETARALATGPRPRNDVVIVITDAEEACLCGAEAFVREHPLARDGGVVLNLEARGAGGPPVMFETATGNAALAGVFGASAAQPVGTSFAVEVYRILPNDTDFSVFLAASRFTGLNSAFIDGAAAYHTPQDQPGRVNKRTLQAMGDNLLSLTRALDDADLTALAKPAAHDATYFPVLGRLARYPGWLVLPFAILAVIGVAVLVVLARRRGRSSLLRSLAGAGLALIPLLLAPIAAQVLWIVLVAIRPGYAGMIDPHRPGWYRVAVVALTATILLAWYVQLRRRVGPVPLAIGAMVWLAVLGVVLALLTPGGSYLTALPALAAAIAGIVALTTKSTVLRAIAIGAANAIAVLVLAPTVTLFFPALGLATGGAPAFFMMLLGLALLPVFDMIVPTARQKPRERRGLLVIATAEALTVAFVATGLIVDKFDASHPIPVQLMYALDTGSSTARWVSAEPDPGEWTRQYVTAREDLRDSFGIFGDQDVATGPATAAELRAPDVTTVSDTSTAGLRDLKLRVVPQRTVRMVYLQMTPGIRVVGATVAGRAVPDDRLGDGSQPFAVLFYAPPQEGIEVALSISGDAPVSLRVMDASDGLESLPGFKRSPRVALLFDDHATGSAVAARTHRIP
ncbi:MAG: M28 family peptidase, partial [Mycobacteriales bacterium]